MRISIDLSKDDVRFLIDRYEAALEGNRDDNDRLRAYHNGTLYGFEIVLNTFGAEIPGLTDKYKGNLGFERKVKHDPN